MEFLNTLADLDRAAHQIIMSGLVCFMNDLVLKHEAPYLKKGIKYRLWKKNDNFLNEVKQLDKDLNMLTGLTIESCDNDNFLQILYDVAGFIINGYSDLLRDEHPTIKHNKTDKLTKILKKKHKDTNTKIWLRFCFRLAKTPSKLEKEAHDILSYIG